MESYGREFKPNRREKIVARADRGVFSRQVNLIGNLRPEQDVFGLVDLAGQICGAALIRVHLFH